MSNLNDFEIKDGVLTKYSGQDEDVAIPKGVNSIGWGGVYRLYTP